MSETQMLDVAIQKRQGDFSLDAAFEVPLDGVTGLVGPSGSGKSTLFACLAGLSKPDAGRIAIGGRTLFDADRRIDMRSARRRIGVVFQDGLLFPHMNVHRNLLYGARRPDLDHFDDVVDALGLSPLLRRRPASLSGGERQRVAIGRALMVSPRLLLMDEPLSSLDPERKFRVLELLEAVRDRFGTPMIYISHAPEEIRRIADRLLMLRDGRLVTPEPAVWSLRASQPSSPHAPECAA